MVDSENNVSWAWFLEKLKELVPDEPELCFISNRNQSIKYALRSIYPLAKHLTYFWHVLMNIRHCFKSCASIGIYKIAVEAYCVEEFNKHIDELRQGFPRMAKYLEEEVGKWLRAHFQSNMYEVMTNNIVEIVNNMLRVIIEYPITALVDFILYTMRQWLFERHRDSLNRTGKLH